MLPAEPDFTVLVPTAAHGANGVVNTALVVASNIAPAELLDKICAALKIHVTAAKLAYKVSNQREAPQTLSNAADMAQAIAKFLACRRRAHVANRAAVELCIVNLARTAAAAGGQGRRGAKRSANVIDLDADPIDVAHDFPDVPGYPAASKKLKEALVCVDPDCNIRQDKMHWCFVNQHRAHVRVPLRFLSLWAKFMALDSEAVTPERPPNSREFEFLHTRQRAPRGQKSATAATAGTTVNIHNDFGALRDILRPSKRVNTGPDAVDLTAEDDDIKDSPVRGSAGTRAGAGADSIAGLLAALDRAQSGQNFAQFGPDLEANGIQHPVHLLTVEPSMFVELLGIPADAVRAMIEHAKQVLGPQKLFRPTSTSSPARCHSDSSTPKPSSSRVTLEDYEKENWEF